MSETDPNSPESAFDHSEVVQFTDGVRAIGMKEPGTVVKWDAFKYTGTLQYPNSADLALVVTTREDGSTQHVALGNGVAVTLPPFNPEKGKYEVTGDIADLQTIDFRGEELPDAAIGEPWGFLGDSQPIKSVVVRATVTDHREVKNASTPSPFASAAEISRAVSERISDSSH